MVQKYLIKDSKEKTEISSYKPEGIDSIVVSVEEGSFWYVRYSLDGNNERTALKMSEIDEYVRNHFNVVVLQNDCSEYFNNRLYPLMSRFERQLRRMLYVFSGVKKDKESVKEINKLEEKNLGDIFSLLFIDDGFMNTVKESIKKRNREEFSKAEILKLVEGEKENTLWDTLLGRDVVPTLRANFQEIRYFRNDIMHSHDIGYKEYRTCRILLEKINKEIDETLDNVSIKEQISKRPISFGKTLAQALVSQEYLASLQAISKTVGEMVAVANNTAFDSLQESLRNMTLSVYGPELDSIRETLKQTTTVANSPVISQIVSNLYKDNPVFQQIAEQQRLLANLTAPLKEVTDTFRQQQGLFNHISSATMDEENGAATKNRDVDKFDEIVKQDANGRTNRKANEFDDEHEERSVDGNKG